MNDVKSLSCKTCMETVSRLALKCSNCGRTMPTSSFVELLSGWLMLLFISTLLAVMVSKWFWLLSVLLLAGIVDSVIDVLKSKSNHLKFSMNNLQWQALKKSNHLDDFKNNLSIVWAGNPYEIEFSYKNSNGDRSRRKFTLEEISVSSDFTPYFVGLCHISNDVRCFRMDRITSKIKYKSNRYDVFDFIDVVMDLDFELVKKLDEAIDERKL